MELLRFRLLKTWPRKHKSLAAVVLTLLFTGEQLALASAGGADAGAAVAGYFFIAVVPALALNTALTYMAYESSLAALIIMRAAFSLGTVFLPVLPNISPAVFSAVSLGVLFFTLLFYRSHMRGSTLRESRIGARYRKRSKSPYLIAMCAACLIGTAAIMLYRANFTPEDGGRVVAQGTNDVSYEVNYERNNIFDEAMQPHDKQYLMSYTDSIHVANSFSADVDLALPLTYEFSATERLLIRSQNGGKDAAAIHEVSHALKEVSGSITSEHVSWDGSEAELPGGSFIVNPMRYIALYSEFVQAEQTRIENKGIAYSQTPKFTADVLVEFNYKISDGTAQEAFSQGIMIPLNNEIYDVSFTGAPDFQFKAPPQEAGKGGIHGSVLVAVWVGLLLLAICFSVLQLRTYQNEAERILEEYRDAIIITKMPIDLSGYSVIPVAGFEELLKSSFSLNKQIISCPDGENTAFCIVADGFAFCYNSTPGTRPAVAGGTAPAQKTEWLTMINQKGASRHTGSFGIRGYVLAQLGDSPYSHDTVENGVVQVRVCIRNSGRFKNDTMLSGFVSGEQVTKTQRNLSKWYGNSLRIIHLDQAADFDEPVEIIANVNLSGMDMSNIYIYSYNAKTNKIRKISDPPQTVDEKRHLHFTTPYAGDIIVSAGGADAVKSIGVSTN